MMSRKRKWRYKNISRPRKIKRLRKEDDDVHKFVIWCKEVGIRISKQVQAPAFSIPESYVYSSILFYRRYRLPGVVRVLILVWLQRGPLQRGPA